MGRRILIISWWQRQERSKGEPLTGCSEKTSRYQIWPWALQPSRSWGTMPKSGGARRKIQPQLRGFSSVVQVSPQDAWVTCKTKDPGRCGHSLLRFVRTPCAFSIMGLSSPNYSCPLHTQSRYTCLWSLNPQGSSGLRTLLYLKMSNEAQQLPFSSVFRLSQRYHLRKTFTICLPPGASNLFLIYFHQITHFQLVFSCHLVGCLTDLLL